MSKKLDKLMRESHAIIEDAQRDLRSNSQALQASIQKMANEEKRVAQISHNAPAVIQNIDKDFEKKTHLHGFDIPFLFLATTIQCVRQYLLTNDKLRFQDDGSTKSHQKGEILVKNILDPKIGDWHPVPPTVAEVLTRSVPYDAFLFESPEIKANLGNIGLSGANHRYLTLGHDPILGLIWGPANITTSSLTKSDFSSYYVRNMTIAGHYPGSMFSDAFRFWRQDPALLPVSIARQLTHYTSDAFTKQGLPIPVLSTVTPDLVGYMVKKGNIDLWSVSRGAALSAMINYLIFCMHTLFWQEARDGSKSMYEIRTRKILMYSNVLATSSNIIVSAVTQDATKLDVGGMMVTLYRLIEDNKFIYEVKKDFLKNELYNLIVGDDYDFMMPHTDDKFKEV